jgi:hypothetical protein
MNIRVLSSAILVLVLAVGCAGQQSGDKPATAPAAKAGVPKFEIDPTWPKVPEKYKLGDASSIGIDAQDNVWVLHRPRTLKPDQAKQAAPAILVFDPAGNFIRAWGGAGSGFEWPQREHGIHIDYKGHVWMGGNNCPARGLSGLSPVADDQILKFTQDGKFVMQVGAKKEGQGPDSMSNDRFYMVADLFFLQSSNEMFLADGYGNRRVAVIDADSGKMKRFWGAYGNKPDDKAAAAQGPYDPFATYQQFRGPVHCADVSNDGFVYVCDRTSNRIQVFNLKGEFQKEVYTQRDSRGDGTTWDTAFSRDAKQQFLYVADGRNQKIRIFDRASMTELTSFGKGGHYPGEWYSLHNIATDSKGNLYTAETYQGRRLQRFLYKGLAPVNARQTLAYPTGN